MELRFKNAAVADLRSFIRHYEDAFFELYRDSGMWSEDAIIDNMRQSAKKLFDAILAHIEKHLGHARVLGRKRARDGWHELCFSVGTRLVIVYFSEEGRKTRWVESISIDRKPIIF